MIPRPKHQRRKPTIIFDANVLFVPLQFGIDIFEEMRKVLDRNYEAILLSPTLVELHRIKIQGSPEMKRRATYALKLAQKCKLLNVLVEDGRHVDDIIVEIAGKHRYAVFTNDKRLRNKLRDINVPVIYVRQKSRLEIDGRV